MDGCGLIWAAGSSSSSGVVVHGCQGLHGNHGVIDADLAGLLVTGHPRFTQGPACIVSINRRGSSDFVELEMSSRSIWGFAERGLGRMLHKIMGKGGGGRGITKYNPPRLQVCQSHLPGSPENHA